MCLLDIRLQKEIAGYPCGSKVLSQIYFNNNNFSFIWLLLNIAFSWSQHWSWSNFTLWIPWIFEYFTHAIFLKNNFAIGVGSIRVVCQITPWDDFWYFTTRRVWGIEDEIQKWFSKNIFCYSANTANMTFCFLLQCFVYEMSSKTITCTDVVMVLCFLIR